MQALDQTVQEQVELRLNSIAEEYSESWAKRPELRGQLFTFLYRLRNTVLNIDPQTVRKMRPVIYKKNITALELLIDQAALDNVSVMLYIPPIRSDMKPPYVPGEYKMFKEKMLELSQQHEHVSLASFETIVPGQEWGMKESTKLGGKGLEYDFMHFTGEGHSILGEAIASEIESTDDI